MSHSLSPVVVFIFNRPDHTLRTLTSLAQNDLASETDVIIFSDGPRKESDLPKILETRQVAGSMKGFRSLKLIEANQNMGLAKSIVSGVTKICSEFGKIIVLEDDMVTSPHFLTFMNDALSRLEKNEEVISIHGYVYPLSRQMTESFYLKGADCWGWATWQRGWRLFNPDGKQLLAELKAKKLLKRFNFDGTFNYEGMLRDCIHGKNNSWAIRWYASALLAGKFTLYPCESLVENIGLDSSGTHCGDDSHLSVKLTQRRLTIPEVPDKESAEGYKLFCDFFDTQRTLKTKVKTFLKNFIASSSERFS